jgi:hypothetical protein
LDVQQRTETRRAIAARVQTSWKNSRGIPMGAQAMLEDVSPGGMSLRIGYPVEAGTRIEVLWKGARVAGTVTYCKRLDDEFILGMCRA